MYFLFGPSFLAAGIEEEELKEPDSLYFFTCSERNVHLYTSLKWLLPEALILGWCSPKLQGLSQTTL